MASSYPLPSPNLLNAQLKTLYKRMTELEDNPDLDDAQRSTLAAWRQSVEDAAKAWREPLRLAFVAQIGMGKSSLVAAATGLTTRAPEGSPKSWSVLPVGDGNTTLGELRVLLKPDETQLVLRVEPVPQERLEEELTFLVEDTWRAAQRPSAREPAAGVADAGEELYGLLRSWLTGGGLSAKEARAKLREWVTAEATLQDAVAVLKARLDLPTRVARYERRFNDDAEGRAALKETLAALMRGALTDAPAPLVTTLSVPGVGARALGIDEVIDTQGLEPTNTHRMLTARPDLMRLVKDPSVMLVICADYVTAPDGVALEVMKLLKEEGHRATDRGLRLLLVDKREDTTSEDARDHRDGRIETCAERLRRVELDMHLPSKRVVAIDVRHEAGALRALLKVMVEREQARRAKRLMDSLQQANAGLSFLEDIERRALRREIDMRLWWAWEAHVGAVRAPITLEPLQGLGELIQQREPWVQHWSHVHATIRRRGRYYKLNLVQIAAEQMLRAALSGADARVSALRNAILTGMGATRAAPEREYLEMRLRGVEARYFEWRNELQSGCASRVSEHFNSWKADALWADCLIRWGQGSGYVMDIGARLIQESAKLKLTVAESYRRFNHEAALPPRPPMLRVRKVTATNFRNITEASKPLGDTTVIIGENGSGKTAWLEGIAKALEAILPGLGASAAPPLRQDDVRQVSQLAGERRFRQPVYPLRLTVEGELQGKSLKWSRHLDGPGVTQVEDEAEALGGITRDIAQELVRWPARPLPVLAYYGTQRLWPPDLSPQERRPGDRLEGYRDCLVAASTHQQLLSWVRDFTLVELQQQRPVPQLRAIKRAVVRCVERAQDFFYDIETKSLVLTLKDGDRLPFAQLSDGVRNIVALAADIAWRASVLNPQLGARAPALAEGVVLIDEIDLHLHPNWQRRVLADLRAAFPRLQFITTTHSPFIIQSLEPGQLVNLNPNISEDEPYADESPEDIAQNIMGVPVPQRSRRRAEAERVAAEYYELLERVSQVEPEELALVKARLDELLAPYNDNPAFTAYTSFLKRKRLVAEAGRP